MELRGAKKVEKPGSSAVRFIILIVFPGWQGLFLHIFYHRFLRKSKHTRQYSVKIGGSTEEKRGIYRFVRSGVSEKKRSKVKTGEFEFLIERFEFDARVMLHLDLAE